MPNDLELILSARKLKVICGEALPVTVTVQNGGTDPVTLLVGPPNPIEFILRRQPDGEVLPPRSRLVALLQQIGARVKPPQSVHPQVLAPGQSETFREDPAAGSAAPIPAGTYELSAQWTVDGSLVVSNDLEITVEAPAASCLVNVYCPLAGSQSQAFDHGGGTQVFHRDSDTQRADAGVFWKRREGDPVSGLSLAVHLAPRLEGRWVGWLEDGELAAAAGEAGTTGVRAPKMPVGLADPILVQPAVQLPPEKPVESLFQWGEGHFLVCGGREGAAHVQAFTAGKGAIRPGPIAPLTEKRPARVLARHSRITGNTTLAWADSAPGSSRILVRSYGPGLRPLSKAPAVHYERRSNLVAWELDPVDNGEGAGHVHALFGPEWDNPKFSYLIYAVIPLGDPQSGAIEMAVPALPAPVDAYAILGRPTGGYIIAAKSGSDVWRIAADGSSPWQIHITGVPKLRHLQMACSTRHYWAIMGIDPQRGLLCVQDPDFAMKSSHMP